VESTIGCKDYNTAILLKQLFQDSEFSKEYNLCSINSINWARIAAQSSYYVWSYLQVFNTKFSIGQSVNYCIPTGAFGNAMVSYASILIQCRADNKVGRLFGETHGFTDWEDYLRNQCQ
jgi:hypothetical protein